MRANCSFHSVLPAALKLTDLTKLANTAYFPILKMHRNTRAEVQQNDSLILFLGSLGPSTVTLIAFKYVATCGGFVAIVIVRLKLFPAKDGTIAQIFETQEEHSK